MRLDKFLSVSAVASRSDAKRAVSKGAVTVNGVAAKRADMNIDEYSDKVVFCGTPIVYKKYEYVLLNKPEGYVSATEDGKDKTVLDLLSDELRKKGVFPCGRLDKNTLGLMLLTNNGELSHRLLSPKNHVEKKYYFKSKTAMSKDDAARFENGVTLEDGYVTKPAKIELSDDGCEGIITLHEGKYHQIKRMLEALDNKIVYLERISFACFTLEDAGLERGEWRYLNEKEIAELEALAGIEN
jgi:16S rRNA pseudouridine516 synthase